MTQVEIVWSKRVRGVLQAKTDAYTAHVYEAVGGWAYCVQPKEKALASMAASGVAKTQAEAEAKAQAAVNRLYSEEADKLRETAGRRAG